MLTEQDVRDRLRQVIAATGGQRAFADLHHFSTAFVSDVTRGRREMSDRVLAAIGIERVVMYREVVGSVVGSTLPKTEQDG